MTESRGGKRVLLVDDDDALLRVMELWLTAAGYAVVACNRFEEARQHLTITPPDVLLTDVRLGAFNGLQLAIFAGEQRPDTVAVVMSAYDDPTLRREAAQCGARFLLKPFTNEELLSALFQAPRRAAAGI